MSRRRLGSRSTLVLLNVSALGALAIGAACSSGSSGTVAPPSGDDSGTSSSSGGGTSSGGTSSGGTSSGGTSSGGTSSGGTSSGGTSSGGASSSGASSDAQLEIEASADGGCPVQSTVTLGVHLNFQVSWPSALASNAGSGPVDIWLLNNATTTGTGGLMFSGTTKSCGTNLPDIVLNTIGAAAVCAPGHTCGSKVSIQILPSTFNSITRTFPTSGSQTGWNPGDTLTTTPALGLLGLTQASSYSGVSTTNGMASTAWPSVSGCTSNCTPFGVFPMSDNADDDGDGNPGITANPKNDTGASPTYTYPPTTTTAFAIPPLADKVFIVSRNAIELTGMRMNDCTHGKGTAKLTAFDNHVVGCHATATSTNNDLSFTGPAGTCDSSQVSFLDQNRTIYGPQPVPSGCGSPCIATAANPIAGTVTVEELSSTATCADVLSIN